MHILHSCFFLNELFLLLRIYLVKGMNVMFYGITGDKKLVAANQADKNMTYYCPQCKKLLILRQGRHNLPHFAHMRTACLAFSEGETGEHLQGKKFLLAFFAKYYDHVELEAYLSELKQRPDLLVFRKANKNLAVEFQCAPLTYDKLSERSTGYRQQGLAFFWFLGKKNYRLGKRMTQKIAQFLNWSAVRGFYLIYVDVVQKRIEVAYQLQMVDFLPLRYLRWYTSDFLQLRSFFKSYQLTYVPMVLPNDHMHQLRVLQKMRYYSRGEMFSLQKTAYVKQANLDEIIARGLNFIPYSPIYCKALFWWHAQALVVNENVDVKKIAQNFGYQLAFLNSETFILMDICRLFLK